MASLRFCGFLIKYIRYNKLILSKLMKGLGRRQVKSIKIFCTIRIKFYICTRNTERYCSTGEMAERSNAAVLKTVDCNRSGGSNPSFSAKKTDSENYRFFYVQKLLRVSLSG